MIKSKEDITDKEFEEILLPFYNNYNEYLIKFIIPDAIAFYLANGYSRNCLSNCPLVNHINSALDIFNLSFNVDELIPNIKNILKTKYNPKIINIKNSRIIKYM